MADRIQARIDMGNFTLKTPDDLQENYCSQTADGTIPLGFTNKPLGQFEDQMMYFAMMGLPEVPRDFDPITASRQTGVNYSTSMDEDFINLAGARAA